MYLRVFTVFLYHWQGIANGVLLITPHSVMFKPNVSDPLVMDRGQDTYSIATLMTSVTSAAMYTDIAAMASHDPLKPGRYVPCHHTFLFHSQSSSCEICPDELYDRHHKMSPTLILTKTQIIHAVKHGAI